MVPPNILVPLDGSKFAEHALPLAIEVATSLRGVIGLVCVSPKRRQAGSRRRGATALWAELNSAELEQYDYLKATARSVEVASSVPVFRDLVTGSPAKELVESSKRHSPTLIVMSTHGRGPLSRAWLGSVADWVVRHVSMPVLLVRPEEGVDIDLSDHRGFGNVMVALDGSWQAEESIKWVRAIGGKDTIYTLVRVAGNSVHVWTVDPTCAPFDLCDYGKVELMRTFDYLLHAERLLNNGSPNVTSEVAEGVTTAVGILNTAEQKGADLIAITTHGRGWLPRLIFGSVADEVVRASQVPVLLVHPG